MSGVPRDPIDPGAPWTAEGVEAAAAVLFDAARRIRENGDEVRPAAFLFCDPAPSLALVALVGFGADKDAQVRAIRALAAERGARYVARVDEAWTASDPVGGPTPAADWAARRSLEDYPGRRELIVLFCDGPGMRRVWTCEILPGGGLGPTVAADSLGGRMANLSGRAPRAEEA